MGGGINLEEECRENDGGFFSSRLQNSLILRTPKFESKQLSEGAGGGNIGGGRDMRMQSFDGKIPTAHIPPFHIPTRS